MQNNEKVTEVKEQENFATEIFREFKAQSRFTITAMAVAMVAEFALFFKWK